MKIRNGFVSNSSSCSYYLQIIPKDINHTVHRIFSIILDFETSFLQETKLENKIKNEILRLESYDNKPGSLIPIKDLDDRIETLKEYLLIIQTKNETPDYNYEINYIKTFLDIHGIDFSMQKDINLSYFTAMHNFFVESIPRVLQEIIFDFAFNLNDDVVKISRDKNN